ncbi:MAG: heavy metal-binding domain-containing protein [Solirubrobacteraceae bacterium]
MEEAGDTFEDTDSLRRVEEGGIPDLARRRLAELEQGAGAFTSDLSVADFALCRQLGLTPLSQVMGTSVYQVGYQPTAGYGTGGQYGGLGYGNRYGGIAREIGEMPVLSQAWNVVRERAFARLAEEAVSVGADAVVGVEVRSGVAGWTQVAGAIEYVVTGTAVRRDGARGGGPVMTELSVADYSKLLAAGVEPAGIVAWTSVFFISAIYFQAEREALGFGAFGSGSFRNFEYKGATQGFYGAREQVMDRLGEQARQLHASGIVGVRISHTIRGTEGAGGPQAAGLIASFSALGTAVHDVAAKPQPPMLTIDLTT